MKKLIVLLVSVFLAGICFLVYVGYTYEPTKTNITTTEQRKVIQLEWIGALREAVTETSNADMKAVLEMIDNQGTTAIPAEDGLLVADQNKPIRSLVLLPEDSKYPIWKTYLDQKGAAAWFQPELQTIILRDKIEFGMKTKSAIFTHEGTHVLHFLKKGSLNATSLTEYGKEETSTYSTANSVLYSFGGQAYVDFRVRRVADMFKKLKVTEAGAQLAYPDKSYDELDKIFGPFKSKAELSWWVGTAWIDVAFHFIDEHAGGTQADKDSLKSEVIVQMTKALGLIYR